MSTHNMFSLRSKKNIYLLIWILFSARALKSLSQNKLIEISYLSSEWGHLDKWGMVFPVLSNGFSKKEHQAVLRQSCVPFSSKQVKKFQFTSLGTSESLLLKYDCKRTI